MSLHFDWPASIARNNNNPRIAKEILSLFQKELPVFQKKLTALRASQAMKETRELIHKLHGSCCYLTLPQLKNQLEILENNPSKIQTADIDWIIEELKQIEREIHAQSLC